ncbi:hypothetical protein LOC71_14765 [Rhodopirellula sp. JC740]|uniref:Polysaccharide biosynthesis protein n=1 Tax=Rhodopirellula halodulae TaxID=2894198 RepID=A0ABS8NJ13_9BACT|nr:hypothetical protein [Rhodopirellula sp. JC740]MCC9643544.1 hypothetical protein [Rhodopirellula sp. JC740]
MSGPSEPNVKRSLPRRWLNRLEVDQAVFYAMSARYWQFLAGPITLLLVMRFFSEETQGYYFTFWSVIGLQNFFELAFPQTILTTASHQWGKLEMTSSGHVAGDKDAKSRLSHLFRTSVAAYAVIALLFCLSLVFAGRLFFSQDQYSNDLNWYAPWIGLVTLSSINFLLIPFLAALEGCNQVRAIYKMHLARAVAGNLVVWACMAGGTTLWVPAIAVAVRIACELILILVRYRNFFASISSRPNAATLDWRGEIWPFQSKLIFKGFFNYFNSDLIVPVLFRYQDAVTAGQFGMTWSVLQAMRGACSAWVRTRVPQMGALVAQKDYRELDRIFWRVGSIALAVLLLLSITMCFGVAAIYQLEFRYATRFLGLLPTTILCVGLIAGLAVEFQWQYLHCHGKSPYVLATVACCCLSGLMIWQLGMHYGVLGACIAYLVMHAFVYLPLSSYAWFGLRREWHR